MIKKRSVGITISYINMVVNMITGLVLSSFLLRALGDTEYGLYQTIASFATYLVLLEFGTGTVMTRNVSVCLNNTAPDKRQEAVNRNYSTIWIISLVLSGVILAAGMVFYFCLGYIYANSMTPEQIAYGRNILLFLFVFIIVSYLTQNINGLLMAHEEYSFANIITLIRMSVRFVLLLALISLFRYAIIIAMVDLLLSAAAFVVSFVFSKRKYHTKISLRYFDKSIFITSIPMCVALLLQTLTNQANSNVDKVVIGIMMSMESVALYSVVQYIFTMFSSVATIPVSMFLPEVSKNMSKKMEPAAFTETLIHPCRLTVLICGNILCGFFAVGKQFVSVLYGAEKTDAWIFALIILVPMFLNMTNAVCINVLDIANKRLVRSLALTATTVANIALTIVFVGWWGILGAVIATAITLLIGNVLIINLYYQFKFKIRVLHLFKEAYKGILPFQIIAAVPAFFLARFIPNALLAFAVGGVVYVGVSFLLTGLFGLNEAEKAILKRITRRFHKSK